MQGTREGLPPLLGVPGLGGRLDGAPPGLVGAVPRDRLSQPRGEVGMRGLPAQLAAELGGVDGVAAVVPGAVARPVEVVRVPPEGGEDRPQDVGVAPLPVRAHEVGVPGAPAGQDGPHGARVVLRMDPVAHVQPVAVQARPHPVDEVRHLTGDELLRVLVGAVVVRTVGDGGADAVGAVPGAHENVRGSLGRAVGARGAVRGPLGEAGGVVERQVAVDLVGRHVVVADIVLAHRLQQAEGAFHVGAQERLGVRDGVVVVGLGGEVDDGVVARDDALQQPRVADVAHHELHPIGGEPRDVLRVAGVGQLVEHRDAHARMLPHHPPHEVGPDEAAAPGDDDVMGLENVFGHPSHL